MPNVLTIREAVQRSKADGMPVSEYTLRLWIKNGAIPVRKVGQKVLLYYPNLVRYLQCEGSEATQSATVIANPGIRRVEI